jgi:hypothetical protein
VLQLVASGVVVVAGLFVALSGDSAGGLIIFGWLLVAVGVLGLVSGVWLRRRP